RVERLHQDALPPARVPDEVGRRRPGEVAHVLRAEPPREGGAQARGAGTRKGLADFSLCDDGYGRVRLERRGEAGALGGREHRDRVQQGARRGDQEARGDGERDIEVTVLEIELALAEVLLG